jgi:hypothetical protein
LSAYELVCNLRIIGERAGLPQLTADGFASLADARTGIVHIRSSIVFVVSLALAVAGCNLNFGRPDTSIPSGEPNTASLLDEPDTAILHRLRDARSARDGEQSSYAEISRDPVGSARSAAARGDYRLIAFYYYALGSDHTPRFPGVRCSIPNSMELLLQRAIWSHYVNDAGPSGPQPSRAFAEQYNRAMLSERSFPVGDLCVVDPVHNRNGDPAPPTEPYFSRLSDRMARSTVSGDEASIAIRNGTNPDFSDSEAIDRPGAFGLTPLAWAGIRGSRSLVVRLLARGANPWAGARCSIPPGPHNDVSYDDRFFTPLALASHAGNSYIVDLMLAAKPRERCPNSSGGATSSDNELRVMLEMGAVLGNTPGHRRIFNYALNRVYSFPSGYSQNDPYEELVEHARRYDLTASFRELTDAEIAQSRDALLEMAAAGTIEELRYWFGRLNVQSTEELASMLQNVVRNMAMICDEERQCRRDGDAKLGWLLDRIGRPTNEENSIYVLRAFGADTGLRAFDNEPQILRRIVASFTNRGYSFDIGNECSLLLTALSYSYSDECPRGTTSPAFAEILLNLGVDVTQRTHSGLTSLDLARRRSTRGPFPTDFMPLVAELERRGVSETNRPTPER